MIAAVRGQPLDQFLAAQQSHDLFAANDREILLTGGQQKVGGHPQRVAVRDRVEVGDHRVAHAMARHQHL